eukprot:GHVU01226567.1.p3 GENE.GHVU01226567.1~~GHVU01226567.1.p3  ORF type:complete len:140 (-),score=5.02 GHVU01226567.1:281-700(-)
MGGLSLPVRAYLRPCGLKRMGASAYICVCASICKCACLVDVCAANDVDLGGQSCLLRYPPRNVSCPVYGVNMRNIDDIGTFKSEAQLKAACAGLAGTANCDRLLLPDGTCSDCPSEAPIPVSSNGNVTDACLPLLSMYV